MAAGDISDALVAEVLAHQFDSTRYSTRIYTWMDKAQKEIVRKSNIRTNQETASLNATAGASTLTLPTDFAREISLTLNANSNTTKTPLQQFDVMVYDSYYNSSTSGTVYGYTVTEDGIFLLPKTDVAATFNLRYWKLPATITTSVDPEIAADYHTLLIDYALFRAYTSEHDKSNAGFHKKLYDEALYELQGQVHGEHDADQIHVAQGTWANAYASGPSFTRP